MKSQVLVKSEFMEQIISKAHELKENGFTVTKIYPRTGIIQISTELDPNVLLVLDWVEGLEDWEDLENRSKKSKV